MGSGNLILILGACLLTGMGCARRAAHASPPTMVIPVGCASEITLLDCDARTSPPKCKRVRVKYRRGCEQIVVAKRK
ncbi:MAG: hypothetical protein LAO24_01025 [Acidobacteriia bacterium]|nr:hypothetical protein [Terriglobia bacterium]